MTSLPQGLPLETVKGTTILWPLLTIVLTSSLHPLNSACSLNREYRRYYHILPLSGLQDALEFLYDISGVISRKPYLVQYICRRLHLDETGTNESWQIKHARLAKEVDFRGRYFPNIFALASFLNCIVWMAFRIRWHLRVSTSSPSLFQR
jgi:hypothetical protein